MSETKPSRNVRAGNLQKILPEMARNLSPLEYSTKLGAEIKNTRAQTIEKLMVKSRKGLQFAEGLANVTDDALIGLFNAAKELYPEEAQHLCLVAVGGYGRGVLAPHSDVDLLILHGPYARQKIKPLLDFILYALWDARLLISQSVHSPASAIQFAKEDLSGNTSFLDARFLIGNEEIMSDFQQRYEKMRMQTIKEFVSAKMEERDQRVSSQGKSRYMVEPDVKEGKGALRDLQTIHWLSAYVYGSRDLKSHVAHEAFTEEDRLSFEKARNFLWSVRVQLHELKGRATEKLSFEVQPEIAARLGYHDRGRVPGVERLMKHYFITTTEVGRLTGTICAILEEAEIKKPRSEDAQNIKSSPRSNHLFKQKKIRPDEIGHTQNFCMRGDRIDFVDHALVKQQPIEAFRLFRIAGRKPMTEIHPAALRTVSDVAGFLNKSTLQDENIATVFKHVVTGTENPEEILRKMAETGLLGTYLAIFGRLIGRVKYGLYRTYTLDEHVLKAIGVLVNIAQGVLKKELPEPTSIVQQSQNLMPYMLAILMHEAIEALPHLDEEAVERQVKKSLLHLVDNVREAEDIAWAVTHYRLMADIASRRNVLEPRVISNFCDLVQTQECLNYVMIITVCHLRVIGEQSWDNWTRRDLSTLYEAASEWYVSGSEGLSALLHKKQQGLRNKTARKLSDWPVSELDRFFMRLGPVFYEYMTADAAARFAKLVQSADQQSVSGKVQVLPLDDGRVEVMVYSRDKPGLYAAIAGTIAGLDGVVRTSTAFPVSSTHRGPDMAANIFIFRPRDETTIVNGAYDQCEVERMKERFEQALHYGFDEKLNMLHRVGDRRAMFDVPSKVIIDENGSEDSLVVEASGLDRPGLLFKLSAALNELEVSIRSAYVATYGEQAVDTFYIQDLPGGKITDKRRKDSIKRKLLGVLKER